MNVILITLAITLVMFVAGILLAGILSTGRFGDDPEDPSFSTGNQPAE